MLQRLARILKTLYAHQVLLGQNCTVGELEKELGIPYSSVKRILEKAENSRLVENQVLPYKSTGKRVFQLTEKGLDWVSCCKELL